jgi:anti-sigma B factor antagonist
MIDIQTIKEDDIFLIDVKGEVDATSSIQLDNAFKNAFNTEEKIMVNLANLEYISSAGLGVFVSHLEEIENKKLGVVLFGLSESVYSVFSLLGLPELFEIVNTKEEAILKLS